MDIQQKENIAFVSDCAFVPISAGEVLAYMGKRNGELFKVTCLHTEGSVWTLIQRRVDGSVNFYRGWTEYKNGFGELSSEFWIGLDTIHQLVMNGFTVLRIELEMGKESAYAEYSSFYVAGEEDNYRIHVSGYSGTAGDGISCHGQYCSNNVQFSTHDNDNDKNSDENSAQLFKGAWWYNRGHRSNLNGEYGNDNFAKGINWYLFKGNKKSLTGSRMMLRRPLM
ncbi:ficolin-1-like [Saccostrea echinata]|uniref:ficolin-1-like n=1 Tax=Saccostrea echinata TaxID=191078 RepID=UPI002A839CB8|nr:ficolin-1-like [Saccostrea echinata]